MSAYRSVLENVLDTADIVRDGDFGLTCRIQSHAHFIVGAKVEFFDDEKLLTPEAPLYCAGENCLLNV